MTTTQYKKAKDFTERDKQILKCLKQVRWSSTCNSLEEFLDKYGLDIKDLKFEISSDSQWRYRKCRSHLRILSLRNAGGFGSSYIYRLYATCNGECDKCVSKIKCSLMNKG